MAEERAVPVAVEESAGRPESEELRTPPALNATYLAAGSVASKLFSFAFVLYATRALQPALYGNFTAAYAFVGIFAFLTDPGLTTVTLRDVAQDRSLALRYISNVLVLRLLFSVVDIVLIAAMAQVFMAPALLNTVYVAALALVPLAAIGTLQLAFQFRERMAYSAVLGMASTAASAALRILVLFLGYHVLALVSTQTAVTLLSAVVMAWIVYTRFLPLRLELDLRWWPLLMRRAAPFAMLTLLNVVYARADMQILYVLSGCGHATGNAGCTPVGRYGAAYLPLDVLSAIFVSSSQLATFTAFSRVGAESREALKPMVRSAATLVLAFGMPVALFGTFFAPEALHVLAGRAYVVAAPALAVLIWAFPLFLVLSMLYNALWAVERQTIVTVAFAVTAVFNLALNVLLIPHYSYMASSVLTVASEVLNGVIVAVAVRRTIGPLGLARAVTKISLVTAAAAAVLWAVHGAGIVVGLPLGAVAVLLGLRLTRVFGPSERRVLARLPLVGRYAAALL